MITALFGNKSVLLPANKVEPFTKSNQQSRTQVELSQSRTFAFFYTFYLIIINSLGMQVDFANAFVGGGVISGVSATSLVHLNS